MLGAEKDWRCPARCPDLGRGGVWRLPEGVCGVIPVQQPPCLWQCMTRKCYAVWAWCYLHVL